MSGQSALGRASVSTRRRRHEAVGVDSSVVSLFSEAPNQSFLLEVVRSHEEGIRDLEHEKGGAEKKVRKGFLQEIRAVFSYFFSEKEKIWAKVG